MQGSVTRLAQAREMSRRWFTIADVELLLALAIRAYSAAPCGRTFLPVRPEPPSRNLSFTPT